MADDLTRPYVGYRSAGRRPESQQDRRASADAPLAALRGLVSGVLGAPGDVESLVRMLPGLSEETLLPTSEDVERRLPLRAVSQTPAGRAFTTAGQLGGGGYMGPGSPLRAIAALPSAVRRAAQDFAVAAGQPAVNVVKPKGGNWLAGSIEREIAPMRTVDPAMMDVLRNADPRFVDQAALNRVNAEGIALDKWLETKLAKYIRNEMGTAEDPIRALAEKGPIHADILPTGYNVTRARREAGFPEEGMGVSPLAKTWEDRADTFINPLKASDITGYYPETVKENPWLLKVPPETPVYEMLQGSAGRGMLGFGHLVDELKNAINPASGLPENLRWKYQDLEKVTVPQAVQRVADINAWRAAQKVEADMARAMGPATQVVKEYPDGGFKWVELRMPKDTGRKVPVERSVMDIPPDANEATIREVAEDMAWDEGFDHGTREFDEFVERMMRNMNEKKTFEIPESRKLLEDALKYEGETMGHCVGGYCDDVASGASKIFSLRDKKGQPHVTIEVKPGRKLTEKDLPNDVRDMLAEQYGDESREAFEAAVQLYMQERSVPDEIIQIKGKANKAPKEEYLPYVQDFVRSQKWGRVGDLENAGLYKADPGELGMFVPSDPRLKNLPGRRTENFQRAKEAGLFGDQEYLTRAEWEDILRKQVESESGPLPPLPEPGFAAGGLVGLHQRYQAGGVVKAAKKTARTLGDLVDEYVRKVRKIEELPEPSYSVTVERPTSAEVPGWHITTDLPGILETGAMTNRNVGARNLQGYAPEHVGGAYFYADPRLARMKRDELLDMVEMDPLYAAELPILRAQLRQANRLVPDEDVGLSIPWQQSYSEGSFATRRPVLLNQIDRIYSSDPGVTKDMIRDTIIRQRRKGYAQGGAVRPTPQSAVVPYDAAKIDQLALELTA